MCKFMLSKYKIAAQGPPGNSWKGSIPIHPLGKLWGVLICNTAYVVHIVIDTFLILQSASQLRILANPYIKLFETDVRRWTPPPNNDLHFQKEKNQRHSVCTNITFLLDCIFCDPLEQHQCQRHHHLRMHRRAMLLSPWPIIMLGFALGASLDPKLNIGSNVPAVIWGCDLNERLLLK